MTRKWIAVNLALAILAGLLGWRLSVSFARFDAENDPSKLQPPRVEIKQQIPMEGGLAPLKQRRHYNPEEFGVIPAQNLFAESRSMQKELETAAVAPAPKLTVRPVLVGVTISGDQRLASIVEPGPPAQPNAPGAGRRAQIRRLGDVIQGYSIVEISENQVVLAYGTQREIIPLYDTTKPKGQGGKTAVVATRVVNIGPGGGGAGGRSGANAPSAGGAITPAVVTTDRPGAQPAVTAGRQPAQPTRNTPVQPQVQQAPGGANERTDEQGRRIIRTPFGDIVREKPPNNP